MEKELKQKAQSERPRRTAVGPRSRINLRDRDPNYHYRLVNSNLDSDPDRVLELQERGYEIVPRKEAGRTGDAKVDLPSPVGSAGEISLGQGTRGVWMRIPKEYYAEDQKIKQDEINATEQRAKTHGADYGSVEITSTRG
jgi:hypothetical protein